jgi:GR25 family glycosyltransferase involved in LPS biosynthesis
MNVKEQGVELLNNYFDKIYLITIPRSWENRKERVLRNLNGLHYDIFWGCDGQQLRDETLNNLTDLKKSVFWIEHYHLLRYKATVSRPLTLSEIGCSESHRRVYEDVVEKGYDKVLILEDDAMLWEPGLKALEGAMKQLPQDWDLWYLGYRWHDCESFLSKLKRKFILSGQFIVNPFAAFKEYQRQSVCYPRKYKKNTWHAGLHAGTHAYAIKGRAAGILLSENTPIIFPADMLLAHCHLKKRIKAYISVPQIFREDQSLTSTVLNQ